MSRSHSGERLQCDSIGRQVFGCPIDLNDSLHHESALALSGVQDVADDDSIRVYHVCAAADGGIRFEAVQTPLDLPKVVRSGDYFLAGVTAFLERNTTQTIEIQHLSRISFCRSRHQHG
jgi:hypothetical protein